MKKRTVLITSILIGSLGVAGLSFASGGYERCEYKRGHHGGMSYMMKELDLTKEQRKTLRELKHDTREQMKNNREQMKELHKALWEEAGKSDYDSAKVRELADKKAGLMSDMVVKRFEAMQRLRQQLTPEQLEELEEMKEYRFKYGEF